jgi:CopG family nickel-responsive transcriptional regulator
MEEKINKIGVSVPNKLLTKFDDILESRGYSTRSDAIRELVRDYVDEYNETNNIENRREIGTINYFYDTIQNGIGDDLSLEYYRYSDIVIVSSHVHINETSCFEMATVRGDSGKIRNLMGALMGIKGVSRAKLVTNKIVE